MASPHVSGAAALIRSVRPGIDPIALRQLLLDHADPVDELEGTSVTGARLDAHRPIALADEDAPGPIDDLVLEAATSNTLLVRWTATGDDGEQGTARAYDLRYSTEPIDATGFFSAVRVHGWPAPQTAA